MNRNNHKYQDIELFGVDYIYGRHGSRFPTGELELLIVATTMHRQSIQNNPSNQPENVYNLQK